MQYFAISHKNPLAKPARFSLILLTLLIVGGCQKEAGFEAHLLEAIELYDERKHEYAALTNGKSDFLFLTLITSERLLLPIARLYDWRGSKFNASGIAIIEADFVPMDSVNDPAKPLVAANEFSAETEVFIKSLMDSFRAYKGSNDFLGLAEHSVHSIEAIEQYEVANTIYLPMLKHVIESIGFGALHAQNYRCESEGATDKLARDFLALQILGLSDLVIGLDKQANEIHQLGVGVLVNDLPTIPVVDEWYGGEVNSDC